MAQYQGSDDDEDDPNKGSAVSSEEIFLFEIGLKTRCADETKYDEESREGETNGLLHQFRHLPLPLEPKGLPFLGFFQHFVGPSLVSLP